MTAARTGHGATVTIDAGGGATAIAGIIDIVGPELAVEQVDGTSLDSIDGYTESVPALKTGGTVTLTVQFTNDQQQQAIRNLIGAVTPAAFLITLPTSPLAYVSFDGVVSSWVQSTEPDVLMPVDIDITITGAVEWTAPPASLYPAWWPTAAPLPQIRATGANWMGMDGGTDGLQASVSVGLSAALPYNASGLTTDHAAWQFSFNSAAPDNRIDLPRNSYIESALITFSALFVGASFAGARIYLKKRDMTVSQATGNGITAWQAAGKLTTAYVAMTTGNTTVGDNTYDVTALINEAIEGAASEWQDANQILQFCVIPNASSTAHAETGVDNLILDRNNPALPGAEIDQWTTRLNITAIVNTGNYETALTQDSTVFSFSPITAADAALTNSMRTVAPTNLSGGRGNFYLVGAESAVAFTSSVNTGDLSYTTIITPPIVVPQIVELPPDGWVPPGSAPSRFFGTAYHLDPLAASVGADDCWRLTLRERSYMHMDCIKWEPGQADLTSLWDYIGYTFETYGPQFAMFIYANPTDGISLNLSCSAIPRPLVAFPIAAAPAVGRSLVVAVLWDHTTYQFRWLVRVFDSSGDIEQHDGITPAATPPLVGNGYKCMPGFGVNYAGLYGQMWIEWTTDASTIWESVVMHQARLWSRGIKSIDPRIMVP
jgi:hypothetical protein